MTTIRLDTRAAEQTGGARVRLWDRNWNLLHDNRAAEFMARAAAGVRRELAGVTIVDQPEMTARAV